MLGEIEVGEATGRCKMAYQARLGVGGLFVCQSCAQRGQVEGVVIRLPAQLTDLPHQLVHPVRLA